MFTSFYNRAQNAKPLEMSSQRTMFFGGNVVAAFPSDASACSAPPLHSSFRLPRLSRDAEAMTRPRTPLRPTKREEASETEAVFDFGIDQLDEIVEFKVEAEEATDAPIEAEPERGVRAQMSALRVAPPAPAEAVRRAPGRPKGSASRPRVEPMFDKAAPPDREKAKLARARIAGEVGRRR